MTCRGHYWDVWRECKQHDLDAPVNGPVELAQNADLRQCGQLFSMSLEELGEEQPRFVRIEACHLAAADLVCICLVSSGKRDIRQSNSLNFGVRARPHERGNDDGLRAGQ